MLYHNRVTDSNLCVCIAMATGVVVKRAQFRQHLLQQPGVEQHSRAVHAELQQRG